MSKRSSLFVLLAACASVGLGCSSSSPSTSKECAGSTSEALQTCASGTTSLGVDVSSYQGTVDWAQVKASGRAFAFVRVSDGKNTIDRKFAANWPSVKNAGLVRGVYQFFRPAQDPIAQAHVLVDNVVAAGGIGPGDLPPVLDIETVDGQSSSVIIARAQTWLTEIETKLGVRPLVYTAAFMSQTIGTALADHELWVANYGVTCPTMPDGWTAWRFWQNGDAGTVPGISGHVDTDLFNGTFAKLGELTIQPAAGSEGSPFTTPRSFDPVHVGGAIAKDGSEGASMGDGRDGQPPTEETTGAPIDPCAP